MQSRYNKGMLKRLIAIVVMMSPFLTAAEQNKIPPRLSVIPAPPSVHVGCGYKKLSSGMFGTQVGIFARNITGKVLPQKTRIKWKIHYRIVGGVDHPLSDSQPDMRTENGIFTIMARQGLAAGVEVKMTVVMQGVAPAGGEIVVGCDAEI